MLKLSKKIITVLLAFSFAAVFLPACDTSGGKNDGKFTISFYSDNYADVIPPIIELPGTPISEPKAPERDGFRFDGWLLNGVLYEFTEMPAQNIRLNAKWVEAYTITFDSKGGSAVEPMLAAPGERIKPPDPSPRRSGHIFMGWLLDGEPYYFSTMPEQNLTLTADWAVGESALPVLNVNMREEDGTPIPITDQRFGPTPWDQGYPFSSTKAKVDYVPCALGVTGSGGLKETVSGRIKPKGNGSFRPNPNARRPYRLKFDKKQSVFGWPKSKQFVLIASNHNDNDSSRLVAHSAFELAREVLSLEYAARTQPVDLYINGVYRGVYIFTEKPRVDEGRLEIESEHAGASQPYKTDTGYLLFYGNGAHVNNGEDARARFGANAGNEFLIESPRPKDIDDPEVPEATAAGYRAQRDFIQRETTNLVNAMSASGFATFKQMADVTSFIDGYILQELYGNTDARDAGFYIYKKSAAQGGKFYSGPPWDFDATVRGGYTGIKVGNNNAPLLTRLYAVPEYRDMVKARWKVLSPQVKDFLKELYDGYIEDAGYQEAFRRGAGSEANNQYANNSWKSNAEGKRDWLLSRCKWLDEEWA